MLRSLLSFIVILIALLAYSDRGVPAVSMAPQFQSTSAAGIGQAPVDNAAHLLPAPPNSLPSTSVKSAPVSERARAHGGSLWLWTTLRVIPLQTHARLRLRNTPLLI